MLQLCHGKNATTKGNALTPWSAPAGYRDPQFANLFAQGVAVDPEQLRGTDLVAVGRLQGKLDQGTLYFGNDPLMEPRGRQLRAVGGKVVPQVAFHGFSQ